MSWQLRIGDQVRIVRQPEDWESLTTETQEAYAHMIADRVVLTVDEIDEFGRPWVTYQYPIRRGFHLDRLAIDDSSWDLVRRGDDTHSA